MRGQRLVTIVAVVVCLHLGMSLMGSSASGRLTVRNVAETNKVGTPIPAAPRNESGRRIYSSSVIRAPDFRDIPCPDGQKRDPKGRCRNVW